MIRLINNKRRYRRDFIRVDSANVHLISESVKARLIDAGPRLMNERQQAVSDCDVAVATSRSVPVPATCIYCPRSVA